MKRVLKFSPPIRPDMETIASDKVLNAAYAWICRGRRECHHNNDIWHLRFHWHHIKPELQHRLQSDMYRFDPVRKWCAGDRNYSIWSARDALVLKAAAIVLGEALSPHLSRHCYHLPGRGGGKGAVRAVQDRLNDARFVFRSDVDSYYANMNHQVLMKQLTGLISDQRVLTLIGGYLDHLEDRNGELHPVKQGICFGCPLSPLMGAVYLSPLDHAMTAAGLCYTRYMDDWVVLTSSRWQLRRAVKITNHILAQLKVEKHPFKTYIGRAAKGFDFLGYRLAPDTNKGIGIAWMTLRNHLDKLTRLYEQGAPKQRIGEYIRAWLQWVRSGVGTLIDMGGVVKEYLEIVERLMGCQIKELVVGVIRGEAKILNGDTNH